MAIINIDKNDVPLKAYLRADPHSQHFKFDDGSELVTNEMFWGELDNEGIYLDYRLIKNRSIDVSAGISEDDTVETKCNEDCDTWIENNICNQELSRFFVVQGYAGCGKSTFLNSVIRKKVHSKKTYIDIGAYWSYSEEPYMFFTQVLYEFTKMMRDIVADIDNREFIWEKLMQLGFDCDIGMFDKELTNIITSFYCIKEDTTWNELPIKLHSYLYNNYSERVKNAVKKVTLCHNIGNVKIIVSLIILLRCAVNFAKKQGHESLLIVFDNLDVIINPSIPAENVVQLWGVMDHYLRFRRIFYSKNHVHLIDVKMIMAVRKVLYSHIIGNLSDLEMPAELDSQNVNVCDISNLYLSQEILNKRINYWKKELNDTNVLIKLSKLEDAISVHSSEDVSDDCRDELESGVRTTINLDAFFNHNYRAFSNSFSQFIDDPKYYEVLSKDSILSNRCSDWKKVSTQVFLISLLYRKEKVWNSMGFGCENFDTIDYPTTLNRLILNYLFISKRSYYLNQLGIEKSDILSKGYVTLEDFIELLSKARFVSVKTTCNQAEIDERYNTPTKNTQELIVERLADMCARNPSSSYKAKGYDSDDNELWRRPLYFVGGVHLNHTASTKDELKEYFLKSIVKNKADKVKFSITDEGFILIKDVVANFEFYSARYCKETLLKPLHQSESSAEINALIQPVYSAVKKCCKRNGIFREQYCEAYGIDVNQYLKKYFHTRTNPRVRINEYGEHKLIDNSFREQIHIVRVIYDHCHYFDQIKEFLYNSNHPERIDMCVTLTRWIKGYLKLYKEYFYPVFENTVCKSDNNIYNELWKLLIKQEQKTKENSKYENIAINRMKHFKK